jgi:hypothetical protein
VILRIPSIAATGADRLFAGLLRIWRNLWSKKREKIREIGNAQAEIDLRMRSMAFFASSSRPA